MKKNIKGIYIFEIILFILVVMFNILKIDYAFNIILVLSAIFCYIKFGYIRDNAYEKSNVNRLVVASIMAFAIIIYGLGLFTGFYRANYNYGFWGYILVLLSVLAIISGEIIRYIIAKNCTKNKWPLIVFTIIFIILNIVTQINGAIINDRWRVFVLISTVILPIIAREMLCSYLAYKCSPIPCIIYRLFTEMIIHFMPIEPNLGDYLYAIIRIILPALIFFFSSRIFKYREKSTIYAGKVSKRIFLLPIFILAAMMIYLTSGLFKYRMIAIGSGSMEPEYYMGDAVIFEKRNASELEAGEILVFKEGNTIITHRIVSITKKSNNGYDIITKGDNNNGQDDYIVQKEDVMGVVRYVVKYIGYPTLWINKIVER